MPYKLRKAPGKALYWVVGEDGKRFSKDPIPKDKAKAQLRALYAAESKTGGSSFQDAYNSGFPSTVTLDSLSGGAGGNDIISATDLLQMCRESYSLTSQDRDPEPVGGKWEPIEVTRELVLYNDRSPNYILAVRGTKEVRDVLAWKPVIDNAVDQTSRYLDDLVVVRQWKKRHPGTWYGTGHSLGGAILDNLIAEELVGESMSFNPAIEPEFVNNPLNRRIYFQGDPLLAIFGVSDPRKIVVSDPSPGWLGWITGIDKDAHKLSNFEGKLGDYDGIGNNAFVGGGRGDVDVEALFAALEGLVGGAFAPKFLYDTAETRTEKGARPRELIRDYQEVERGLRALAHKNEESGDFLRAFGARVMADDVYEHRTGQATDWGHNNVAKKDFIKAFRGSRADQIAELGTVNSTMAQYDLPNTREGRAQAYRIAYAGEAPPRRAPAPVARVLPVAEVRADVEGEARRAREDADRRRQEEEARLREAAEWERARRAEEEMRRVVEDTRLAAERRVRDEDAREAEEARRAESLAQAEEERVARAAEAAAVASRASAIAEADAARRRTAQMTLEAMEETDEDTLALNMAAIIGAAETEQEPLVREMKRLQALVSNKQFELREEIDRTKLILRDPYQYVKIRVPLLGILSRKKGGDLMVKSLRTKPLTRADLIELRKSLAAELKGLPAEALGIEFDGVAIDPRELPFIEAAILVAHPTDPDYDSLPMFIPPTLLPKALDNTQEALSRIETNVADKVAERERFLAVIVPEREAPIRGLQADIARTEGLLAESRARVGQLTTQLDARIDSLRALKKEAKKGGPAKKKGKKAGQGRQHKAFPYSRAGMSASEKAAERAKHYRDTVKEARMGKVKVTRLHEGDDVAEGEAKKRALEKSNPEKKLRSVRGTVLEWTEVQPAYLAPVVAARGPKEVVPKTTLPKAGSVRKPYVGKKMKEAFMEAVKGKAAKEQTNLFNKAKRLYKAGGKSWEAVMSTVVG